MAAQVVTLVFAIVGGIITGFILKLPVWDNPTDDQLYDDEDFWKLGQYKKMKFNDLMTLVESYCFDSC